MSESESFTAVRIGSLYPCHAAACIRSNLWLVAIFVQNNIYLQIFGNFLFCSALQTIGLPVSFQALNFAHDIVSYNVVHGGLWRPTTNDVKDWFQMRPAGPQRRRQTIITATPLTYRPRRTLIFTQCDGHVHACRPQSGRTSGV